MSNNDLISREYLRDAFDNLCCHNCKTCRNFKKEGCSFYRCDLIDNAPIVERPQGECVDISKLRLMTVEECAGHTIDYAMGWKACIEWIKKGGVE